MPTEYVYTGSGIIRFMGHAIYRLIKILPVRAGYGSYLIRMRKAKSSVGG